MILVDNKQACTGCLICELACSFHHIRNYSHSHSSIRVNKDIFAEKKEAQIYISYDKQKWDPVCDLCDGEESPFCIRFCPENVFKLQNPDEIETAKNTKKLIHRQSS